MKNKEIQRPLRARCRPIGAVLSVIVLCGGLGIADQSRADSTGVWGTVAGGAGTSAESPTHKISGTLGQWAAGRGQASSRRLEIGFWSGGACDCRHHGDIDADGDLDILDVIGIVNTAFRGLPDPPADALCPHANRGDVNCDGLVNVIDVVLEVAAAFRGDNRLCNPCAH